MSKQLSDVKKDCSGSQARCSSVESSSTCSQTLSEYAREQDGIPSDLSCFSPSWLIIAQLEQEIKANHEQHLLLYIRLDELEAQATELQRLRSGFNDGTNDDKMKAEVCDLMNEELLVELDNVRDALDACDDQLYSLQFQLNMANAKVGMDGGNFST